MRNRMLLAGGAIIAVVAVAFALVLVKVNSKPAAASPAADGPAGAALARVVKELTSVPASVLDTVGAGSLSGVGIGRTSTSGSGYLAPVSGPPLTSGGTPEVLYLGADFCPYCAAVRWPLIVALSRFGTFSGLRTTRSGIANGADQHEPYPATPTWSQIAAALRDPSSAVAKRIGGSANYLTAAFCKLTGDQPATACTPAVRALESRLG